MSSEAAIRPVDCEKVDFGTEWKENYGVLIGRARSLARGSRQEPEDILSQATVKVLNYIRLEREITNFAGLMLVSIMQVHIDSKRRLHDRVFSEATEYQDHNGKCGALADVPCAERTYIAKQTLADIQVFLSTLPAIHQELFRMRFIEEMPFSAISRELEISEANARQKIRVLRTKLKAWAVE